MGKNRLCTGKLHISKMYLRFMISFLIVLFLPIICFTSVFMHYFAGVYREKIIKQAEDSLATAGMELVRDVESLEVLVSDDALGLPISYLVQQKDYTGQSVRESLNAKRVNHLIVDEICYYNPVNPSVVYTSAGTYSLDLYAQVYAGLSHKEELLTQLEAVKGAAWICWPSGNENGKVEEPSLQYVIKRYTNEWWIFTINNTELRQILMNESSRTILEDKDGNALFQAGVLNNEDCYRLSFADEGGVLLLSRYVSEAELFAEFSAYQRFFLLIVVLLLFLGGALILVLTYFNEHPIREMQAWVRDKMPHIPENTEDMEIFRFAIHEMEDRIALSESRRQRNRLLLRMIYGHGCETEVFQKEVWEAGLFQETKFFRVVLAVSSEKGDIRDKVSRYLDVQEKGNLEIRWLDAADEDVVILIAGMNDPDERDLKKELLLMEDTIRGELGRSVSFCVGGLCEKFDKIHQSYSEALLCSQKCADLQQKNTVRVFFYERESRQEQRCCYPEQELQVLKAALLEADVPRIIEITEGLIGILREGNLSHFVAMSLYYDILNAYYKAQIRLNLDEDFELFEIGIQEARDRASAVQMIISVREQYLSFVKEIQGQRGVCMAQTQDHLGMKLPNRDKISISADGDEVVVQVLDFIEESVQICDLSVSMVADNFCLSISIGFLPL